LIRRLAAAVAALGLTLVLAVPVFATDLLQGGNIAWNDSSITQDCTGVTLQPGQVLWHFVLNQSDTPDATMTATFSDSSDNVTAITPDKTEDHYVLMWDVITGQDTLISASTSGNTTGVFVLSHICDGGPPPDVPEAPASALLVVAAGVGLLGFMALRMRRSHTVV
jgi:hypothetical protein